MPRSRIIVEFADRPAYPVRIGGGLMAQLGRDLRAAGMGSARCLAVCDPDSAARCLPALKEALGEANFAVTDIAVSPVEPEDAWACVAELHRAFAQLELPPGTPIVVCACVQVAELAAFAVATYGGGLVLVAAPASLAAAYRTLAIDAFELDTGLAAPVHVPAAVAYAVVDTSLLGCESAAEADMGLDELDRAGLHCDSAYRRWQEQNAREIAAYDEDACVLALTQTLAARADALGGEIASRISG